MSKIVQAINSMIQNRADISDVISITSPFSDGIKSSYDNEDYDGYYFKFMKYVWSIKTYALKVNSLRLGPWIKVNSGPGKPHSIEFALVYYPGYSDVMSLKEDLVRGIIPTGIRYTTEMDKTKEAYESYEDLYRIVREKLYNVDSVLDDIISLINDSE